MINKVSDIYSPWDQVAENVIKKGREGKKVRLRKDRVCAS
jgi:hypothetical protein